MAPSVETRQVPILTHTRDGVIPHHTRSFQAHGRNNDQQRYHVAKKRSRAASEHVLIGVLSANAKTQCNHKTSGRDRVGATRPTPTDALG